MRVASRPSGRQRPDQCLFEIAHVLLHVLAVPAQVENRVTDELTWPVGTQDFPPRFVSTTSTPAPSGTCSSSVSLRRPSVTTGRCSRKTTASGIAPWETAPASGRWRSRCFLVGNEAEIEQVGAAAHAVQPSGDLQSCQGP